QVPDAREALAQLSAAVLGDPARALELVGVTGTNGKTTTTYLIDAALRAAGHQVGLLGTVLYRIGDRMADATRTTPESSDLQGLLREMVDAGCSHAVLEVSSHSLELRRVAGLQFRVAVFTNLTRDHLDFHGDMDSYFHSKRKLFAELVRPDGRSVINADDDRAAEPTAVPRAHGRRAQEPAGDGARARPPPRDHRLRLRGRPRSHETAAHGRGGLATQRRRDRHFRQPPLRAPGGYSRRDTEGDERRPQGRAPR